MPPLRTDVPLVEQQFSVIMIAGLDRSSSECVEILGTDSRVGASGCLIAFRRLNLGPIVRLAQVAIEQGVSVPFDLDGIDIADQVLADAPDFSPEVSYMALGTQWSEIVVWPDEPTRIPEGAAFELTWSGDRRDEQKYLLPNFDGSIESREENLRYEFHLTARGLQGHLFAPTPEVEEFLMIIVAMDTRGSQSWAVFEFEVGSE